MFKKLYFDVISRAASALAKTVGPIHAPFTKKDLHYKDVLDIRSEIQVGDFILTRTNGELTTAVIPGFWKHTEIYVGDDQTIGAVAPCVRRAWLADEVMRTDNIAVLRLCSVSDAERLAMVDYAAQQLGKPYDFSLNVCDETEEYCSEVAYHAVNLVRGDGYLQLWRRMGYDSFTPNDLWGCAFKKSGALFDVVYLNCGDEDITAQFAAL